MFLFEAVSQAVRRLEQELDEQLFVRRSRHPTLTEAGIADADLPIWMSLWAPAGTPQPIIARVNAKVVEIAGTAEMNKAAKSSSENDFIGVDSPEVLTG